MNTFMTSSEIREAFLNYFERQNHQRVASSSLIPGNDPTLLFTNAGMVQFKDTFLGQEKRDYVRATSSQRCVRAGGKHNDLENVGYTARHHTFFEMLGNFSFGDYFKREAIKFAWEFLTQELKLPEEKLWVTVHIDDQEAEDIWLKEMGISAERFSKLDEDNFWQMGDTGPCGPSSEIFFYHCANVAGDPPGGPNDDGDRYIEIWNLVFMQFERHADGRLEKLPNPSIDTGMGLERIAAVMQGVHNNYDIDIFQGLLKAAASILNVQDLSEKSLRVIADHIRSCAFLIVDGVVPGNEGRSYVLRRIIRRAIRHGNKLGATENFFYQLVPALVEQMGEAYPELLKAQAHVEKIILAEEDQFAKTLNQGMQILDAAIANLSGVQIPGDIIFKLYDSHGFPVDLTNDIAREKGLSLDMAGYDACMDAQRKRSQAKGQFDLDYTKQLKIDSVVDFSGYQNNRDQGVVLEIYVEGEPVSALNMQQQAGVILDKTPFYAESGGQVGDVGALCVGENQFIVENTTKSGKQFVHWGYLETGEMKVGDSAVAEIDTLKRQATALNHTATHLLHAALREVLGQHVTQKGSLVDSDRLRFDFSHFEPVTEEQLQSIEDCVNAKIRNNTAVETIETDMDAAKSMGAMALFGEKYDNDVRVVSMADQFSIELCGGTHAQRTGDIALMLIESESGVASGVRRIEAITGAKALNAVNNYRNNIMHLSNLVKAKPESLETKVAQLVTTVKAQERRIAELQHAQAASAGSDLISSAKEINGVKVLAAKIDVADRKQLLGMVDELKSKLEKAVIFLAGVDGTQANLVAGVTNSLTKKYKAGDLMKHISQQLGGKGGGRPDMAQGAASDLSGLDQALESVYSWVDN